MSQGDYVYGGTASALSELTPNDATAATDIPIARRGGLDIATLLQQANTGAQGRPMPSYTSELANTGSRIAKILERSLAEMEADKGFDKIGAGLAADIASGGKMPYAVARQQFEGREVGRAVNIANALAGMSKIGGGDLRSLGTMLQRRTEAEARQGNMKAQRINEMIRAAAGGFEDSSLASAQMYGFIAKKQKENPNLDMNELPGLMAEAIMDARRSGLARKVTGGRGKGKGASTEGGDALPVSGADGEVDYTKRMVGKGRDAQLWNMSTVEQRKKLHQSWIDKAAGSKKGGGDGSPQAQYDENTGTWTITPGIGKNQDAKFDDEFRRADVAARDTVGTMDDIRSDLTKYGGNIVGFLGDAGGLLNGLKAQLDALITGLPDQYSKGARDRFGDVNSWDEYMPAFVKTGANASVNKARFVTLAYALASSREPGGRLTEQDVARAMKTLGEASGDPRAINMLFDDAEKSMTRRMRAMQIHSQKYGKAAPWSPRGWDPYGTPQRPGGGAPDLKNMSTEDLLKALD